MSREGAAPAYGDTPLADLVDEVDRVLAASRIVGVDLRLMGGLAVRRICPSAAIPPLSRTYADVDLVISSRTPTKAMSTFMSGLGYTANESFNALHSDRRLYYVDVPNGRHVDVFVDTFHMCHTLDFKNRLRLHPETLPPTDLLLSKLQVVELNRKDTLDILALLLDKPVHKGSNDAIDSGYLEHLWSADWPLWRTCGETIGKVRRSVPEILGESAADSVLGSLATLETVHADGRRSLAWRVRSRIGDRIKWYDLPEEV